MNVTVNGQVKTIEQSVSVDQLIRLLGLKPERLAVEINRRIVRRSAWESTTVGEGDRIEIVNFVGGGQ